MVPVVVADDRWLGRQVRVVILEAKNPAVFQAANGRKVLALLATASQVLSGTAGAVDEPE